MHHGAQRETVGRFRGRAQLSANPLELRPCRRLIELAGRLHGLRCIAAIGAIGEHRSKVRRKRLAGILFRAEPDRARLADPQRDDGGESPFDEPEVFENLADRPSIGRGPVIPRRLSGTASTAARRSRACISQVRKTFLRAASSSHQPLELLGVDGPCSRLFRGDEPSANKMCERLLEREGSMSLGNRDFLVQVLQRVLADVLPGAVSNEQHLGRRHAAASASRHQRLREDGAEGHRRDPGGSSAGDREEMNRPRVRPSR